MVRVVMMISSVVVVSSIYSDNGFIGVCLMKLVR